ncbi:MAG: phosphopantetheine-binding protein [Tenericutes bacterium]|mgnify:FL=1|nr:phosphopantetheine-binding protein [Mycoplasmatota bacterium]
MEELLEILENIKPGVDYENCETLIDDHYLDSLSILSLIADIEDEFDVVVPTVEIVPTNFNSVKSMLSLINKLKEED